MIRQPTSDMSEIYTDFPLFAWVKCEATGVEVRREKVYRKLCGPFVNGAGRWKYVRASAVTSKEESLQYFENRYVPISGPAAGPQPIKD